jgi:hypothetical protein
MTHFWSQFFVPYSKSLSLGLIEPHDLIFYKKISFVLDRRLRINIGLRTFLLNSV